MTACPQGSGAGHLCRLLGGLQGPWSCGTLCSKAMGITNPGAPRQAHGAPLSAGLSSGLCHLSLGTFSPSLPHPLPYFLLGTGGGKPAEWFRELQGGQDSPWIWRTQGGSRCHQIHRKPVERDFWCHRLAGHGAGEGSEAERWKSSRSFAQFPCAGREGSLLQRAWLCPAPRVRVLTCSGLQHVEVPLPSRIPRCWCGAVACKKFN